MKGLNYSEENAADRIPPPDNARPYFGESFLVVSLSWIFSFSRFMTVFSFSTYVFDLDFSLLIEFPVYESYFCLFEFELFPYSLSIFSRPTLNDSIFIWNVFCVSE